MVFLSGLFFKLSYICVFESKFYIGLLAINCKQFSPSSNLKCQYYTFFKMSEIHGYAIQVAENKIVLEVKQNSVQINSIINNKRNSSKQTSNLHSE